tara:strand:- start:15 stop:215 length:201 start_codon:yes stop_codon:yes gene_type:complete
MSYSKQQLVCLEQLLVDIQSTLRTIQDSEQYDSLKDKCSILDLDYTIDELFNQRIYDIKNFDNPKE